MSLRLSSLVLLFACAPYLPVAQGTGRVSDVISLDELDQYATAVTALEKEFLSLIEAVPSGERFYLYWTYNHLVSAWVQVEDLQVQLERSLEAESYAEEESIRTALRDQAEFVRWELGQAVEDLEQAVHEGRPGNQLRITEALRSLLSALRTTVDRLWALQCAYVTCVAVSGPSEAATVTRTQPSAPRVSRGVFRFKNSG